MTVTDNTDVELTPTAEVEPDELPTDDTPRLQLVNHEWQGRTRVGIDINLIISKLLGKMEDWPKNIGGTLYALAQDNRLVALDKPDVLFAWLQQNFAVDWWSGVGATTKAEFFEALKMQARWYAGLEYSPHYPLFPKLFYHHTDVPDGNGETLDAFLNFFGPDTPEDYQLIIAMICTIFWGGPGGQRPAFLITSADKDEKMGRGVGKSTLASVVSDLACGHVAVSQHESIEKIKTRLLTPANVDVASRVILLDNLKTHRFSWAEMESLITASTISGHLMYRGDASRPNVYTLMQTINGASLSKDMAHRTVVIKLRRPLYAPSWLENVKAFVAENRWEIIGDVIALLKSEGTSLAPNHTTRWGAWDNGVLSKLQSPEQLRALIIKRQTAIDDDATEGQEFYEFLKEKCSLTCGQFPCGIQSVSTGVVGIRQSKLMELCQEFYSSKIASNVVTKKVNALGLQCLEQVCKKGKPRRWIFRLDGNKLTKKQLK